MGIYTNGDIYGIEIYRVDNDDNITLFTEKYETIMNDEQMREVYLFYKELNEKNSLFFKIYTECCSSLDKQNSNFMSWYPISFDTFLEKFNISYSGN